MPTRPNTWRLASATKALPGPTILSTGFEAPCPEGQRADGLRPAERVELVDALRAAPRTPRPGPVSPIGAGATMTIRSTPAIFAGTVFISTDDG
jgi:hypothetical protein